MHLIHGNILGNGQTQAIVVAGEQEVKTALLGLEYIGANEILAEVSADIVAMDALNEATSTSQIDTVSTAKSPQQIIEGLSADTVTDKDVDREIMFYEDGYSAVLSGLAAVAKLRRKEVKQLRAKGLLDISGGNVTQAKRMLKEYGRKFGKPELVYFSDRKQ